MTSRAKLRVAAVCAGLAIAGVLALAIRNVHDIYVRRTAEEAARRRAADEAEAAAARERLYRRFGIDAPGTQLFVPLSGLTHSPGRAMIGGRLFNDPRLTSLPNSRTLVCGRCHQLGAGGTDSRPHHGVLTRPVFNAAFATSFLHDGSAPSLEAAVEKMIADPHFSGGGAPDRVAERLAGDADVAAGFRREYGDGGLTGSNVVDAVAEYVKTLVTDGTPYDFWCAGHADRLAPEQRRGSEVFLAAGCMECHDGPVLGSRKVENGRKVPALRGLGLRRAFLTDGKVKDLGAAISLMPGGGLPPEDRQALVAFLKAL